MKVSGAQQFRAQNLFRYQLPRDKHDLSNRKISVCPTVPLYKVRTLLPPTSKDCGEGWKSWQM